MTNRVALEELLIGSINTGLDAIRRAPIVAHKTEQRCLRIQDISNSKPFTEWGFTETKETDYEKYRLRTDDIIMARTCSTGICYLVKNDMSAVFNNGLARIRVDKSRTDPSFLYYIFKSKQFESYIDGISGGTSVQLNMKVGDLAKFEFSVPKLSTQKAIAHILGTLDDKIELNQKMNQTLEEIAKAIFKSWFVDFDPVRAKAEGRPTGLPPEISDLFPDELVDSEIGEIPEGWDVVPFSDTFEFLSGGTPKTSIPDYWNGGVPWFSIADLNTSSPWVTETEKSITELGLSKCSAKRIQRGTTIITARGTVGKVALAAQDMAINQSCYAMKVPNDHLFGWLYLQTLSLVDLLKANAHGSVFDTITRKTFEQFHVAMPHNSVMKSFHDATGSMFDRMLIADKENSSLKALRDTLLPKLISGELRIPDAENFLEEAGI